MIIVLIFLLHIIFVGYIFIKKLKKESLSSALINLAFIIIFFSVGWSISGMLVKLVFEPEGFGRFFDRDTITLTLLTIAEYFFFKFYYKDIKTT
ncbi:MAG: hypothetical protein IPM32_10415 [Ignavibacteriae bacterium]|nr:hypothetical protein [Ignavibacteriota bacterium]